MSQYQTGEQRLAEDFRTLFPFERTRAPEIPVTEQNAEKNRVAMLGTTGAGKSAVVAGLGMICQEEVKATVGTDYPFFCTFQEKQSEIFQDMSNLRNGHFPAKTAAYSEYTAESSLILEWERHFKTKVPPIIGKTVSRKIWHKAVHVPICDIAGEDLSQFIRQVQAKSNFGGQAWATLNKTLNYVRESDGYIIIIKGSRAQGFSKQLEREKDKRLSEDPDVNLVRMLQDLVNYKRGNRTHPVRGVAVVVTAWDKLKPVGDEVGFDLCADAMVSQNYSVGQRDLERFVSGAFPSTYTAIKSLRVPNVQYFPMFFLTEKEDDGITEKKSTEEGWEGTPLIKRRELNGPNGEWFQNLRRIYCAEKQLVDLLYWLKGFARAV
jgi:hypothetical protein